MLCWCCKGVELCGVGVVLVVGCVVFVLVLCCVVVWGCVVWCGAVWCGVVRTLSWCLFVCVVLFCRACVAVGVGVIIGVGVGVVLCCFVRW